MVIEEIRYLMRGQQLCIASQAWECDDEWTAHQLKEQLL